MTADGSIRAAVPDRARIVSSATAYRKPHAAPASTRTTEVTE